MRLINFVFLFLIPLLLLGCSIEPPVKTLNHKNQLDVIRYVDTLTPWVVKKDSKLTFDAFINELADTPAVFVGEQHDRYDNHLIQFKILKALHQRNPNIAIGLEWFQQPYQWVLNRYLNGTLSEKQLLEKSEYYKRWQYRYAMLRPIMLYAKQQHIPIIALNAPVEVTRKVGKSGLGSLTPKERRQLPKTIHPASKTYRKRLEAIFKEHSKDKKMLENFITVQRIWDETMAMNAHSFLASHPSHQIIVFAGNGHISDHVGIPADLKRYSPIQTATISSGTQKSQSKMGLVDYFVITQPVSLPKVGRLGVILKSKNKHVVISLVSKDSAAEKAGLQKGDQFQAINGIPIHKMIDFKQLLESKKPNDRISLKVLRKTDKLQTLSIPLVLQ